MIQIFVCTNQRPLSGQPSCGGRGSELLLARLQAEVTTRQLDCRVKASVCMGHCEKGPNLKVSGGEFYHGMDEQRALALLDLLVRAP